MVHNAVRRQNLVILKSLFSSSSCGDTPTTLEIQSEASHLCKDADISHEIEDLINFVDNFEFGSPRFVSPPTIATQYSSSVHHILMKQKVVNGSPRPLSALRDPLTDRTNETFLGLEGAKSNINRKLMKQGHSSAGSQRIDNEQRVHVSTEYTTVPDNERQMLQGLIQQVDVALRDAWKERDEARAWAKEVRVTTQSWVEEQRKLIQLEQYALKEAQDRSKDYTAAVHEARIDRLENYILDLKNSVSHHQQQMIRSLARIEEERQSWCISVSRNQHQNGVAGTMEEVSKKMEATPLNPNGMLFENRGHEVAHVSNIAFQQRASLVASPETPVADFRSITMRHCGMTPPSAGLRNDTSHSSNASNRGRESVKRIVTLPDGTRKEIKSNGASTVRFPNGDIMITSISPSSVAYYHARSQVIQVDTNDGSKIFEFLKYRQVERHYPDGRKIVRFPDGIETRSFPNGAVELFLPSGKHVVVPWGGIKPVKYR